MNFHLPRLDPEKAYITSSLFLPKKHIREEPIRGALTFGLGKAMEPRVLVKNHPHHIEVPRTFMTVARMMEIGIPEVVDLRPTKFETTTLRPKSSFRLRPSQDALWGAFSKAEGGVLHAACGSGKTVLGLYKMSQLQVPALVVAPQHAHLRSWEEKLHQFFDMDGPVGWIEGKKMEYDREVVFATVQTLAKRAETGGLPPDFHLRFGVVLYDEVHHLSAEWFATSADVCAGARFGLTATPKRNDMNEGVFFSHLGKVFFSDETQELVPEVYVLETGVTLPDPMPRDVLDKTGALHFGKLYGWLGTHEARNKIIQREIDRQKKEGRVIYALSHSVEQVRLMAEANSAGCMEGDTPHADRLDQLNNNDLVFATMGVGTENYDKPELDCLFLLTPFKAQQHSNAPAFQQSSGRILRPLAGKPTPRIIIVLDDIPECRGLVLSLLREARRRGFIMKDQSTCRMALRKPKGKGW